MKNKIIKFANFTVLSIYSINSMPVFALDNIVVEDNKTTKQDARATEIAFNNEYLKSFVAEYLNKNIEDVEDSDYLLIKELDFSEFNLTGEIPTDILKFTNLESLDLSSNKITGSIPNKIISLTNLRNLNLSNNEISGDISSIINSLNNIEELNLRNNKLTGSIPSEIGNLKNLKGLYLSGNLLEGEIPNTLYSLSNIRWLDLSNNLLETIDFSKISNLTELEELYLNNNKFSGNINTNYNNLKKLKVLNLSENKFEGTVPLDIANTSSLTKLDISSNKLTGELVSLFDNLNKLNYLDISNNIFTGEVPKAIYTLTSLDTVKISNNQFLSLPNDIEDKYLNTEGFYDNNIIKDKTNQKQLKITENINILVEEDLTVDLALYKDKIVLENKNGSTEQISDNYTLKLVDISDSNIISTDSGKGLNLGLVTAKIAINTSINNSKAITEDNANIKVIAKNNWLNNAFAEKIGKTREELTIEDYKNTTELEINNYEGAANQSIPDDIIKFVNLTNLNLANNNLEGNINGMIGLLSKLETLDLSHNKFVGEVPESICGLNNLNKLDLTYNQLTNIKGTLDSKFLNDESLGYNILDIEEAPTQKKLWIPSGLMDAASVGEGYALKTEITESIQLDVDGEKEPLSSYYYCQPKYSDEYFDETLLPKKSGNVNMSIYIQGLEDNRNAVTDNTYTLVITDKSSAVEKCEVIIKHIDVDTKKELTQSITTFANVGEEFIVSYEPIDNYIVVGEPIQSIMISDADTPITIVFEYRKNNVADNWLNRAVAKKLDKEYTELTDSDYQSIYSLDLTEEPVGGSIPADITKLVNLEELILKGSFLSGELPSYLSELNQLKVLNLEGNSFTGNIPNEIFNMSSLEILNLKNNELSGVISSNIGNAHNLKEINLSYNNFTGSIPSEVGQLNNLIALKLDNNKLTGELPTSIYTLSNLEEIKLYNNKLTGSISENIGNLNKLKVLDLENNNFSDNIPSSIGNLLNLEYIWLNNNAFTGELPETVNNLKNLVSLRIQENNFTGNLFNSIYGLPKLNQLIANNNDFSGEINIDIAGLRSLSEIRINNNKYIGTIPEAIFNLPNLNNINLKENYFIKSPSNIPELFDNVGVLGGNILEGKENQYQLEFTAPLQKELTVGDTLDLSNIRDSLILKLGTQSKSVTNQYKLSFEAEKEYFNETGEAIKAGSSNVFVKILEADSTNKNAITSTGIAVSIKEVEPEVIKGSVNIKYLDNKTGAEISSEVINDVDLGEYTYKAKTIDGYTLVGNNSKTVNLTKENANQVIEFRYDKIEQAEEVPEVIKGSVNIKYLDNKTGAEISSEVINDVDLGEYTYKAKTIDGYTLVGDNSKTVNLTKENANQVIEFRYDKIEQSGNEQNVIKGKVTIKYRDLNTGELLKDSVVHENLDFNIYTYKADDIEGYSIFGDNIIEVILNKENNLKNIEFTYIKQDGRNIINLDRVMLFLSREETMPIYSKDVKLDLSIDTLNNIWDGQENNIDITLNVSNMLSRAKTNSNENIANLYIESNIEENLLTDNDMVEINVDTKYNDSQVGLYIANNSNESTLIDKAVVKNGVATFKGKLTNGNYDIKLLDNNDSSDIAIPDTSGVKSLTLVSFISLSLLGVYFLKKRKDK